MNASTELKSNKSNVNVVINIQDIRPFIIYLKYDLVQEYVSSLMHGKWGDESDH